MSYTWPDAAEWRSRRRCREARARRAAERQPEPEDGLPWSARTRSGDAWTLGYYGALRKGGASLQACVLVLLFAAAVMDERKRAAEYVRSSAWVGYDATGALEFAAANLEMGAHERD